MSIAPLEIILPGAPFAQPRPRAFRRGRFIRMHDTDEAIAWKRGAAAHYRAALGALGPGHGYPAEHPVRLEIVAAFPPPAAARHAAAAWSSRKCDDADNVAKAVMDAGNGILWTDDGLVALLEVARVLAPAGHPGCVGLRVSPAPDTLAHYWWHGVAIARPAPGSDRARARASRARVRRLSPAAAANVLAAAKDGVRHGPGGDCAAPKCRGCRAAEVLAEADPIAWWAEREP